MPSWQIQHSPGQPAVIPCHRGQGTAPAAYEDHIVIDIMFSKKTHKFVLPEGEHQSQK